MSCNFKRRHRNARAPTPAAASSKTHCDQEAARAGAQIRQLRLHPGHRTRIARRHLSLVSVSSTLVLALAVLGRPSQGQSQFSQQQQQQQQQQYQQSSLSVQAGQHQATGALVNSNHHPYGMMPYQNDQPALPPTPGAASAPLSSFLVADAARQPQHQHQPQATSVDLDNAIESTTTSANKNTMAQQPFPLLVSSSSPAAATFSRLAQHRQQQQQQTCQLPLTWAGRWYQANKEPIRVTNTEISDKGICRDKKGDKYLFESTRLEGKGPCLICLVINERHLNVLQYKESSCQPIPASYLNRSSLTVPDNDHSLLDSICSDINGDAQLESLFRLDTPATECPINGKFHFSYDDRRGDICREPLSSLDSCIDKKQLNFKFSACPDVAGSESKFEVLKCYADWSEGNNHYMIGRLEHASSPQDKGKFRCFVYEKTPDGELIMSQSLEESCYGLTSASEGPKVLRLAPRAPTSNKCRFPAFIQGQSENWLSVDNSLIYMFNRNSTKYQVMEAVEGNVIEEATCLQQFTYPLQVHPHSMQQVQSPHPLHHQHQARSYPNAQVTTPTSRRYSPSSNQFNQVDQSSQQASTSRQSSNDAVYLIQITKDCSTTDYCVRFHRRTNGIVQIDYFRVFAGSDGQQRCRNAYIGTPETQIITSTNLEHQRCPFDGAYTIEAPLESDFSYNPSNIFICPRQSFLTAQCDHPSRLSIHYRCSPAKYMIKNLYCLGSWTTSGHVRLLLADDERKRYSAWYRDYGAISAPVPYQQQEENDSSTPSSHQGLTRSQQLIGLSSGGSQYAANSLASIVDLQIALLTTIPTISKPMQVRLTRRSQCSDLRGYSSQGSFSSMSSSSVPSYASPSAASSAVPSAISSILLSLVTLLSLLQASKMLASPFAIPGAATSYHFYHVANYD